MRYGTSRCRREKRNERMTSSQFSLPKQLSSDDKWSKRPNNQDNIFFYHHEAALIVICCFGCYDLGRWDGTSLSSRETTTRERGRRRRIFHRRNTSAATAIGQRGQAIKTRTYFIMMKHSRWPFGALVVMTWVEEIAYREKSWRRRHHKKITRRMMWVPPNDASDDTMPSQPSQ